MAGIWLGSDPILLASASPARAGLLRSAGLPVETEASGVDERAIECSLGRPRLGDLARVLAREKALAVAARRPNRLVIGADQVLDLDGEPIAKLPSAAAAAAQLARMAGRTHRLHSAAAIVSPGRAPVEIAGEARLTVRNLSGDAINTYVAAAGDSVTRSAGAYEIEGLGIHLFSRVEGDQATILGLPMLPLLAALRDLGLLGL